MQTLGYVLLARILFATMVLDQMSSQAIERRLEMIDFSEARQSLTKNSIEAKSLFGTENGNGLGVFLGARLCRYFTPHIFVGGGGYAGRLLGSAPGAGPFGYGGLLVGGEIPLGNVVSLEASALVGAGGGKFQSASGPSTDSGLVFEPQAALNLKMFKGVRAGFQTSYFTASGLDGMSGWTLSFVVDFRQFNVSLPE